ncbi:MAG: Gldg family protein [Odoribacteraceae bacterium]|jgi:gliding-associated putative ABC transporter substrate-binding component GldG|nr:Gldg family protein [Odoribacteraceae bacterium]
MIKAIIQKELTASLNTSFIYLLLGLLAGITGAVYWFTDLNIFYRGEASMDLLFRVLEHALLLLVPCLTMHSIANERKAGTLELLLSKPIKSRDIIGGKYCAALVQATFFLLITSIYYFTVFFLSDTDPATGWCGYLGLLLVAGCYTGLGIFASSLTRDARIALLTGSLFLLCFRFLFQCIAGIDEGSLFSRLFHFLSVEEHFGNISRGIIDTRDLIYFCSIITLSLVGTGHRLFRVNSYRAPRAKKRFLSPLHRHVSLLLAVNILSCFLFFRFDATSNKLYSLSPISKSTIARAHEEITVNLYISDGLSPEESRLGRECLHLLKEFKNLHHHRFTINVITLDTEEKQRTAMEQGILPIAHETINHEMVQLRTILFGATIKVGNHTTTIPRIRPFTPLEYEFTRALKQYDDTAKPLVGFLTGHNEFSLHDIDQVVREISSIAGVEPVSMHPDSDLARYKVICIIGPTDSFSPRELDMLEAYTTQGGRLFIALNHAMGKVELTPTYGFINRVGIEDWLERFGLRIKYDFIVDRSCNAIPAAHTSRFLFSFPKRRDFPYAPIIINFSQHPITDNLHSISLEYASSIETLPTLFPYTFTWLAKSSSMSGVKESPAILNPLNTMTSRDFNKPKRTVAALLHNEKTNSAIVTITDADFMQDDSYSPAHYDNISFAVNAIEWLADDPGLIKLRNKYTARQTIKPTDHRTRAFFAYTNFFFPLAGVGALALWAYQKKRRKQLRRLYSNEL